MAFLLSKKRAILGDDMGLGKTRQAIAAALRAVPDGTDFADMITWAITAVYTEHDFPHNPDTVRQAVGRQLAAPGDP